MATVGIRWVSDIAVFKTISGSEFPLVCVEGYLTPGDGGGGYFYLTTDTTSHDNGATIIVLNDGTIFYRIWQGEPFSVLWAGADPTGASPSDSAFATAASVSSVLYVPVGRYRLESQFSYTLAVGQGSFTLKGDGSEASVLFFPNNSGMAITYNAASDGQVHVRDISITAGVAGVGSGVQLIYSSTTGINGGITDLSRLKIRGDDGVGALYWNNAISIVGASNVNMDGIAITGPAKYAEATNANGIVINGNSIGSIVFNITNSTIYNVYTGVTYGSYAQGVFVTNSQLTNMVQGILIPEGTVKIDELCVSNSQFTTDESCIISLAPTGNVQIANNLLTFGNAVPATTTGIIQGQFGNATITGNAFDGSSSTGNTVFGIIITSGPSGAITGNVFIIMDTGIWLQANVNHFNVQSNSYNAVTTLVINNGSNNIIGGGSP